MTYGIKLSNPLDFPVRVEVLQKKKILREVIVRPHQIYLVELKQPGDYDLETYVVDPIDPNDILGPAGVMVTDHQEVSTQEGRPFELAETADLVGGYWTTVIRLVADPGEIFRLRSVEPRMDPEIQWRLKRNQVITPLDGIITFDNFYMTGGQAISIQAKRLVKRKIQAACRIFGESSRVEQGDGTITPAAAEQVSPALRIKHEEEEVAVRPLSDMLEALEKQEVLSK